MSLFTPRLEFSPDPLSDTTPTWTDITAYCVDIEWWGGKTNDLGDPEPGGMQCVLNNAGRRFEPDYVAGAFYPNIDTERRFRLSFDTDGPQGIEFWGDFEAGAAGTAPEWTVMNGAVECLAGSEARQLTYVTSPTPRLGAKAARFEVASGDKFGATSGERCEVRRGTPNGGFATGTPDGVTAYYQFSFRCLAPWTHPSGWEIFHQQHSFDARFGQAMLRLQVTDDRNNFRLSLDTGEYPTLTDANNGTNAGTNYDFDLKPFAADTWFDCRYAIKWSSSDDGWIVFEMKTSSETEFTRYVTKAGIQTLPTVKGNATVGTVGDKIGFYRNDQAITNVVFHDGYQVGHSWTDVAYPTSTTGPEWNQITWDTAVNIVDTNGNPSFEIDAVGDTTPTGVAAAGGGTTTFLVDDSRKKFGEKSLKILPNGGASGQGAFHTQSGGTRWDVTVGTTYTAAAWFSGDTFQTVRIGIEWFTSGGASIQTDFCVPRALRTDFRHLYVTVAAPATAATARIRTSNSGTSSGNFWVDGVGFWEGTYGITYTEGLWYAESWEIDYPGMQDMSQVTVTAVDGMGLLSADTLPLLDPPDATSYEDVVNYDEPSFYYQLGEPEGTKLVSHVRTRKRKGKTVKRRFKTRETKAEVTGIAGPSGTYVNTPTLGVPGLILGDSDTAVKFNSAESEYAKIQVDQENSIDRNRLTIEAWVDVAAPTQTVVSGPYVAAITEPAWELVVVPGGMQVVVRFTDGTSASTSVAYAAGYYAAVWDSSTLSIYQGGGFAASVSAPGKTLRQGDANEFIRIGARKSGGALTDFFDGVIDEVAIYEKALEPERIAAHFEAGANRGYGEQLTGARIAAVASSPLWSTAGIEAGAFVMQPTMQFGQGKLDEIVEAVSAERPRSMFYFSGSGAPIYRDFDSLDGASNDLTLGDVPGEIGYTGIDLVYDNEVYNTVTGSTDGGTAITVTDAQSVSDRKPRTRDAETNLPLRDDDDVRTILNTIVNEWSRPAMRPAAVATVGKDADRVAHILGREIGDRVRVRRRGEGGTPIDRQTFILGYRKKLDRSRILSCTWNLARGFNATDGAWHLGVPGYSELDSTAVLG